jgi:hypothetical protein
MKTSSNPEAKCWTYDTDLDIVCAAGEYIASIGKGNRVVSIWLILSARRVVHRKPREQQGWALEVVPARDMQPLAVYDPDANKLWVRGEPAHPFFWYSRDAN